MSRQAIPSFAMSEIGRESLRREGVVVTTLAYSVLNDPRRLQPHYHDFFQLMLLQGRGEVMHDFRDYRVRGSTLLFLTPGQIHSIRPTGGFGGIIISFSQSFFDHKSPPPSELLDLPFFFPAESAPILPIPHGDVFRISQAFAEVQREFEMADALAAESLRAWLRILFARTMRLHTQQRPVVELSARARLVREFHLAVEAHFREERTLEIYARELGVSANHLNDVIRGETKRSAGGIIRQRRLLDAKRLLSHSELSVSEIGYRLGFHDPSYFGRFFRKGTGSSPAAFREEIREKYHTKGP